MRAVVIAIKENKAAVAGSGGHFGYVDNNGYEVGQILEVEEEVFYSEKALTSEATDLRELSKEEGEEAASAVKKRSRIAEKIIHSHIFVPSIAAAAVMLLFAGVAYANAATAYTVSFSGDASVELSMNVFDRVVGINAADNEVSGVYTGLLFSKLPKAYETVLETVGELNDETDGETHVSANVEANSFLGESRVTAVINELTQATENWNESQDRTHISLDFSGNNEPVPVQKTDQNEKESEPVTNQDTEKEKNTEKEPVNDRQENQEQGDNNKEKPTEPSPESNDKETKNTGQIPQPETVTGQENTDKPTEVEKPAEDKKAPDPKPAVKDDAGNQSDNGTGGNSEGLQPPSKPDQGIGQDESSNPANPMDHDNPPEPGNNSPPPEPPGNEDHNDNREEPHNMGGSGH